MALIENKISVDGNATDKIVKAIKKIWKEFQKLPMLLKVLLALSILGGGGYFAYVHFSDRSSMKEIESEVEVISLKVNENLSESDYKEDLIYIITEILLLQQQENQSYSDEELELDLLIDFITKYHPNDPIVNDLESMKNRLKVNHDSYKLHYDYVMKELNKVVNDSIK